MLNNKFLLQNGWTAMHRAAFNGHASIVNYLLKEAGAKVDQMSDVVSL